jgi:hypothetical protein
MSAALLTPLGSATSETSGQSDDTCALAEKPFQSPASQTNLVPSSCFCISDGKLIFRWEMPQVILPPSHGPVCARHVTPQTNTETSREQRVSPAISTFPPIPGERFSGL